MLSRLLSRFRPPKLKLLVNTHPYAWYILTSDLQQLPTLQLESANVTWFKEPAILILVNILRQEFPDVRFTPASWKGASIWDTQTFQVENGPPNQEQKVLLSSVERVQQEILDAAYQSSCQRKGMGHEADHS